MAVAIGILAFLLFLLGAPPPDKGDHVQKVVREPHFAPQVCPSVSSFSIPSLEEIPWQGVSHGMSGVLKKQLITNGEVPHLLGLSVAEIKPGQRVERHAHESKTEVFYVLSGSGTLKVVKQSPSCDSTQTYKLSEGITAVVKPREAHELAACETCEDPLKILYFGLDDLPSTVLE